MAPHHRYWRLAGKDRLRPGLPRHCHLMANTDRRTPGQRFVNYWMTMADQLAGGRGEWGDWDAGVSGGAGTAFSRGQAAINPR